MAFWDLQAGSPDSIVLLSDSNTLVTYRDLSVIADAARQRFPARPDRTVGFLLFDSSIDAVATYLAALRSGRHVPLLLQPSIHATLLHKLVETYQPEWIAGPRGAVLPEGYEASHQAGRFAIWPRSVPAAPAAPDRELALLLSTSGSTGSPRLVRLSYKAIASNAAAIVDYLRLTAADRAVSTLPFAYSFGLSILNSHLAVGGSVMLTDQTLLARGFWQMVQNCGATSLSGVPSQFAMLRRAGFEKQRPPSLRMLTQAGGNLGTPLTLEFERLCRDGGLEFYVMYGQTEASPRISYVPSPRLRDKVGSIGIPIPGGRLDIADSTNELIYRGDNVMMGYATCRADLARGDDLHGVLATGDTARRDDEGFFYLTGRTKRFVKMSGARVNLDEVEASLAEALNAQVACVGADDRIVVCIDDAAVNDGVVRGFMRERFDIHGGLCDVQHCSPLPLTGSGKVDYQELTRLHVGGAS